MSLARRIAFGIVRQLNLTPTMAVDSAGIRYHMSTLDRAIGVTTFSDGSYDQHLMSLAFELITQFTGRPAVEGRQFIDIGANIGTAAIPAVKIFGAEDAICFEPDPENFKLLRYNLIANDLESKVKALNIGLTDTSGSAHLERHAWNMGGHRILRGPCRQGQTRETIEVWLDRFDDVAAEAGFKVDNAAVVWLDTEGLEGFVLAGATTILKNRVPVVTEYSPSSLRKSDGLALLNEIIATNYQTVIDLRASYADGVTVSHNAQDIDQVEARYAGTAYTDLLLLK
jgi:FkbM family methyltransferase